MSGALAERVFAEKLERAGFEDAARYPLFTPELIEVMKRTISPERQEHVAAGVIVKARRP